MERALAFLLLVILAGCSAPAKETVRAPVTEPRIAARSIPYSPPPRPPARLLADYLIIDKSERILIAYKDGQPIRAYRGLNFGDAPAGHKQFEGDERTPEGLYFIDTRNPRSSYHLSLRISYPNLSDRAFAAQYGRSAGGDIFIHGQPTGYRGPELQGDWTDGCIALTNEEIEELWSIVPDGTPIEIRP
ncbi:L,D-transpeptidase family protein [Erythrobacter sp.]|nr:L,D-transpeptidase family protein [Erythrobacter sp.]